MRKIFLAVVVTLTCLATFNLPAAAKDVWIDSSEGVETYIMDETIEGDSNENGKWLRVDTKIIKDGEIVRAVRWIFTQDGSDGDRLENWFCNASENGSRSFGTERVSGTYLKKIIAYCLDHLGM